MLTTTLGLRCVPYDVGITYLQMELMAAVMEVSYVII